MSERLDWADSLKGLAICGVVLVHSGGSHLPSMLGQIGSAGARGVQLFFIVSAFFTFLSLDRYFNNVNNSELTKHTTMGWLLKKVNRIAPLYYIALIICLISGSYESNYWHSATSQVSSTIDILTHFLFINGLSPYYVNSILSTEWFIADLFLFYVISLWIYKKITSVERAFALMTISVVASTIISYGASLLTNDGILTAYIWSFCFITEFPLWAMGIFIYNLKKQKVLEKFKGNKLVSYSLLLFSICLICSVIFRENAMGIYSFGIGFAGLILSQDMVQCPLICNKFWATLGKYSFGIYLAHTFVIPLLSKITVFGTGMSASTRIVFYIIVMAASLLIAALTQKFIETPIASLGDKLIQKILKTKISIPTK